MHVFVIKDETVNIMKKIIGLLVVLLNLSVFAGVTDKKIDSKIEKVTVFLRGAQVNRTASTSILAGVTLIKLGGLSPNIDANSIEVTGKGSFTILSVTHSNNYLNAGKKSSIVMLLEDSLTLLKGEHELKTKLNDVLESEWRLINANTVVNNNAGFDIEDLDDLATYYRERLSSIAKTQLSLKKEQVEINKNISRVQQQLNTVNNKKNSYTGEIVIEVMSKVAAKAGLEVSYYVQNAGWTPIYDLRVKDSNSPISLSYKAKVYQSTGVEWANVDLILSTGNPSRGATKPTFYPWSLSYINNYQRVYGRAPQMKSLSLKNKDGAFESDEEEVFESAQSIADYTTVSETTVNSVFAINIQKTIPSDGKKHVVSIKNYELNTEYKYFAAPKLDKDVFLVGRISGWEDYNLLSGQANIFYDGTYTGKSFIDIGKSSDTLELSLGRDNGVIVNRTKIKEFTQNQIIGPNKKETVGIAISIRNTKSLPVKVNLMDQLPVSTDASIIVEVLEITGAKQELDSGYLNWDVSLEPAETMNYVIKYTVKYPKEKQINL